jgi:hypothetical protein
MDSYEPQNILQKIITSIKITNGFLEMPLTIDNEIDIFSINNNINNIKELVLILLNKNIIEKIGTDYLKNPTFTIIPKIITYLSSCINVYYYKYFNTNMIRIKILQTINKNTQLKFNFDKRKCGQLIQLGIFEKPYSINNLLKSNTFNDDVTLLINNIKKNEYLKYINLYTEIIYKLIKQTDTNFYIKQLHYIENCKEIIDNNVVENITNRYTSNKLLYFVVKKVKLERKNRFKGLIRCIIKLKYLSKIAKDNTWSPPLTNININGGYGYNKLSINWSNYFNNETS